MAKFDESQHPRVGAGSPSGGQFTNSGGAESGLSTAQTTRLNELEGRYFGGRELSEREMQELRDLKSGQTGRAPTRVVAEQAQRAVAPPPRPATQAPSQTAMRTFRVSTESGDTYTIQARSRADAESQARQDAADRRSMGDRGRYTVYEERGRR